MGSDEKALAIFEKKVSEVHGPVKENNEWRNSYNYELYALYENKDIVSFIKVGWVEMGWSCCSNRPATAAKRIFNAKPEDGEKEEGRN
jgi:hypothetical protein